MDKEISRELPDGIELPTPIERELELLECAETIRKMNPGKPVIVSLSTNEIKAIPTNPMRQLKKRIGLDK